MMALPTLKIAGIALVAGTAAGLTLGWMLWRPAPVKQEPPAPAIRQADNSLILERKPDAHPAVPHQLPKGAKLERQISVTVQPSAVATAPTNGPSPAGQGTSPAATPCPPVTVDLSLVRMPDKTRRVIASARDGQVVGGLDVSVDPQDTRVLKRAILTGYNPVTKDALLGYTQKLFGPVEAGAMAVYQNRKLGGYALVIIRF